MIAMPFAKLESEKLKDESCRMLEMENLIHGVIRFVGGRALSEGYAYLEEMGFTQNQMRFYGFDVDGTIKELKKERKIKDG